MWRQRVLEYPWNAYEWTVSATVLAKPRMTHHGMLVDMGRT